jgi:hypothetical protein
MSIKLDLSRIRSRFIDPSYASFYATFQWEHFLEYGIDAFFIARYTDASTLEVRPGKASDFWKQTSLVVGSYSGVLSLPPNVRTIVLYSRRAFRYPHVMAWLGMPDLRPVGNETDLRFFIGVENGGELGNGIASFMLYTDANAGVYNRLCVHVGTRYANLTLNLDAVKPPDYQTVAHHYRIIITKNLALFYIDSYLRAVAIQCIRGAVTVVDNVAPYSIGLIPPLSATLTALVEILTNRTQIASASIDIPLMPIAFRVADGGDIALSLPLSLANNDVLLRGYSISSGSVTSHPVPLWGFNRKTIYFMADQAGTLAIEIYMLSGNWRTYDTVSVPANTLVKYRIDDEVILARVVFTPSTYPVTIFEAEARMS